MLCEPPPWAPCADCTVELFEFMLLCWHQDVVQRPTFARMVPFFKKLCAAAAEATPAVEPRMDAYKRMDGFNNQYNDMGFDNDGTQSPHDGTFSTENLASLGAPAPNASATDNGAAQQSHRATLANIDVSMFDGDNNSPEADTHIDEGAAAGSTQAQGSSDISAADEAARFTLTAGAADAYAENPVKGEPEFGFGDDK